MSRKRAGASDSQRSAAPCPAPLRRAVRAFLALILAGIIPAAAQHVAKQSAARPSSAEDFFIISSVDLAKKQLLIKRPTEVTEVMRVDDNTRYLDEKGKAIQLSSLRAGDTVYIQATGKAEGALALSIRLGPMTAEELRRRYLNAKRE